MFEADLRAFPWWGALYKAAERGADAARREARFASAGLDSTARDDVATLLLEPLDSPMDASEHQIALAFAAAEFAGPSAIARVGRALRDYDGEARWLGACCLDILERRRCVESAVQLMLAARRARDSSFSPVAAQALRGYPELTRNPLLAAKGSVPANDLGEFFSYALERAMIVGARFSPETLTEADLAREVLSRVVWGRYRGRLVAQTFTFAPDEAAFIDADFEEVALEPGDDIAVVHPVEVDEETRNAWGLVFADYESVGLFRQFDRVTKVPDDFPFGRDDHFDGEYRELHRWLAQAGGWKLQPDQRSFEYPIRGSRLLLRSGIQFDGSPGDVHFFELHRPNVVRYGVDDAVVTLEATAAAVSVLERFAPSLL